MMVMASLAFVNARFRSLHVHHSIMIAGLHVTTCDATVLHNTVAPYSTPYSCSTSHSSRVAPHATALYPAWLSAPSHIMLSPNRASYSRHALS